MVYTKLETLSTRTRWIWFIAGLAGSVICQILFGPGNAAMADAGYGILDLEFAWNPSGIDPILSAFSPIESVVVNFMIIDMFFPIFYFLTLSGWGLLVKHKGRCLKVIITASLVASLSDYIENIFTFVVLNNPTDYVSIAPFLISLFASVKFAFIVFAIIRNLIKMIFKK